MTGSDLLWAIVKMAVMFGFLINVGAILTWLDRRQGAMIQDRVGPNRAVLKIGKFELRVAGLLHLAADGVKFFFKEDFVPPNADKLLFAIAPILAMAPVLALTAVIPMGDTVCPQYLLPSVAVDGIFDWMRHLPVVPRFGVCPTMEIRDAMGAVRTVAPVELAVAPLNVGILYIFAMAGQGIVGAAIAGWSSDNKFSLMGALRAASQMVSYEVAMGLSLIGAMMIYGTVRLDDMVRWQGEFAWGVFVQPIAFILFFVASVAEQKRIPFDLPEAESELVSGYFTEYSGMKFGMFYFAEYMEVVTSSMLIVTIFLGGWALPFFHRDGLTVAFGGETLFRLPISHLAMVLINVLAFFGKVLIVCWFQAVIRWTLPRFRYDQLMKLGWRVLLPASLANIMVTGVVYLAIDQAGAGFQEGLRFAADVSQGVVAVLLTAMIVSVIVFMAQPARRQRLVVGSSAKLAAALGGTRTTPMQA
jgi:NADH-quinone oxidoreductase subunit H